MFVLRRITEKAASGLDLAVEFSTLGEYGFLPEAETAAEATTNERCGVPARAPSRAPGVFRLVGRRTQGRRTGCESERQASGPLSGRIEAAPKPQIDHVPRVELIGALRTPRIEPDWAA